MKNILKQSSFLKKKLQLTITMILLLTGSIVKSQDKGHFGIYLTSNDYKENTLSYLTACEDKSVKHKIHKSVYKPYIELISTDQHQKINKSELYGYKDCHGHIYRFSNKEEYKIIGNNLITLYSLTKTVTNPDGKGIEEKTFYYFSKEPDGELIHLTIYNLKKEYKDNIKFIDLIDTHFKYDHELIKTDSYTHEHIITRLLKESNEQ